MAAVSLALVCALVYGAADFFGGLATRRDSAVAVVVWSQAVGLGVLLVALPFLGVSSQASDLWWGVACGLAGGGAIMLLYRGLAIGTMGVVSPITAVLAAAVPVAFAIARGERPAPLAVAGIVCALVAVIFVSASDTGEARRAAHSRALPPGVAEALGAGIAFGFLFIGLAQTRSEAGLVPVLMMRVTSMTLVSLGALLTRRSLRIGAANLRTVALAGALDMGANVAYVLAAHLGALSIVAVISSLYPAGTVALAAFILHERLLRAQWVGVLLAFAGVLCISLAR